MTILFYIGIGLVSATIYSTIAGIAFLMLSYVAEDDKDAHDDAKVMLVLSAAWPLVFVFLCLLGPFAVIGSTAEGWHRERRRKAKIFATTVWHRDAKTPFEPCEPIVVIDTVRKGAPGLYRKLYPR